MKLFIDTEFCPINGHLLSVGMVSEEGAEFYAVVSDTSKSEWVREHVLPKLRIRGASRIPYPEAQALLRVYLKNVSYGGEIEIITDWPDDIKYFCELLVTGPGERIPGNFTFTLWESPPFPDHPMRHNALIDAGLLRDAWLTAHKE